MARILIVEDDAQTAKSIARELKIAGHACAVHSQGNGVVEVAKKSDLDLLVLDIMMPDISGFQICRAIRDDASLDSLPILIVSAMSSEEEVQHGLDQGADDYVTKPFEMSDLLRRVNTLLQTQRQTSRVDELTDLADAEGSRRELQRRLSRGEPFALAYGELVNLQSFSRQTGAAGREKALRYVARALHECAKRLPEDVEVFSGHMGGGHFMCMLPAEHVKTFCEYVRKVWAHNLEHLYETQNKAALYHEAIKAGKSDTLLDLLFCITTREADEPLTAKQILDVVARIRNNRRHQVAGGVYLDRRT